MPVALGLIWCPALEQQQLRGAGTDISQDRFFSWGHHMTDRDSSREMRLRMSFFFIIADYIIQHRACVGL